MEAHQAKNIVAIVRHRTFDSLVQALDLCEGLRQLRSTDRILLKPNVLWGGNRADPPFGRVTTSTVVGYVLRLLREYGCRHVAIGEGAVVSEESKSDTARAFAWSGIEKVAKEYEAELVDFNAGPYKTLELEGTRVRVAASPFECDYLIDLPVLKTHQQATVSLGMKNLKGLLSYGSRQKFHKHDLNRLIALLNTEIQPELTIIDGIYGLERGPDFLGTAHRRDLLIAGRDVLSCDAVGASVMGIEPGEVEHLAVFASLRGRSLALGDIEVRGEPTDQVRERYEWRLSIEDVFREAGIRGISVGPVDGSICTGCAVTGTGLVGLVTKDCPGTEFDGVQVCLGRTMRAQPDSKQVFLIGDCAIAANQEATDATRIGGCPPSTREALVSFYTKTLPRHRATRILAARTAKDVGKRLGLYSETFPAFGKHDPPEFDRRHF